ncbi:hypothetical protein SETIT_7G211100v2 [Setaria italica]|uniref:Uncharacterized protein n=1 Tax=Setaria italica TaxID=4555 RepID=A0A368RY59_SETIT|nr:hypothetical protein SETIT_7G211100v2 [Setaria italica]
MKPPVVVAASRAHHRSLVLASIVVAKSHARAHHHRCRHLCPPSLPTPCASPLLLATNEGRAEGGGEGTRQSYIAERIAALRSLDVAPVCRLTPCVQPPFLLRALHAVGNSCRRSWASSLPLEEIEPPIAPSSAASSSVLRRSPISPSSASPCLMLLVPQVVPTPMAGWAHPMPQRCRGHASSRRCPHGRMGPSDASAPPWPLLGLSPLPPWPSPLPPLSAQRRVTSGRWPATYTLHAIATLLQASTPGVFLDHCLPPVLLSVSYQL